MMVFGFVVHGSRVSKRSRHCVPCICGSCLLLHQSNLPFRVKVLCLSGCVHMLSEQNVVKKMFTYTTCRLATKQCICSCFSSPIRRARTTTEIIWQGPGREGPCSYLDSLKEAHLGWMEGMKQGRLKACLFPGEAVGHAC